jgi:hypothetical protein
MHKVGAVFMVLLAASTWAGATCRGLQDTQGSLFNLMYPASGRTAHR